MRFSVVRQCKSVFYLPSQKWEDIGAGGISLSILLLCLLPCHTKPPRNRLLYVEPAEKRP